MASSEARVPVVDLQSHKDVVLDRIREACTNTGFFVLTNHGITKELSDAALANCRELFSLSDESKLSLKSSAAFVGYQPYGGIHVDPQSDEQEGDRREGFYLCKGVPWVAETEPDEWPDQWPSEELLPGFRATGGAICKSWMALTRRIARLLSEAVGEPESWLEGYIRNPFVAFHNLHYAPIKSQPEKGILGLGAHSDFGLFTLLLSDQPGLQILEGGEWHDLDCSSNQIIVNLGDQLQRCTNDKFKSQVHRVISHGADRYSVAFFVNADYDSTLECLPSCCSAEAPAKYQPIKSSDFMHEKFSAVHKS